MHMNAKISKLVIIVILPYSHIKIIKVIFETNDRKLYA